VKIILLTVGRPSALLADAIQEYEDRATRYWKLETVAVAGEKASRNRPVGEIRAAEADRLRGAVPDPTELVALARNGKRWSSQRLARYLSELAVSGGPGATFVIGGAYGLDRQLVREARHQLSLSDMTMPHDLARLVFVEQLYRAGTIVRGEPYHKG
jgi:23S rRNA (pseudouridine1915-N3)-methyltransferase